MMGTYKITFWQIVNKTPESKRAINFCWTKAMQGKHKHIVEINAYIWSTKVNVSSHLMDFLNRINTNICMHVPLKTGRWILFVSTMKNIEHLDLHLKIDAFFIIVICHFSHSYYFTGNFPFRYINFKFKLHLRRSWAGWSSFISYAFFSRHWILNWPIPAFFALLESSTSHHHLT